MNDSSLRFPSSIDHEYYSKTWELRNEGLSPSIAFSLHYYLLLFFLINGIVHKILQNCEQQFQFQS